FVERVDPPLVMLAVVVVLLGALRAAFGGRADLVLENLALRQQLAAFAHSGSRPQDPGYRPTVLDGPPPMVVGLARCAHFRQTRDGRPVAPRRISPLLEMVVPPSPPGPTGGSRCPRNDPPNGHGEPDLGCAADPRPAAHARPRGLGAHRLSVPASASAPSG